jgi:hypothetical protein
MPKVDWAGNINVGFQLGTGFWVFLTVLVLLVVFWHKLGSERMGNVFSGAWHDAVARPMSYSKN